MSFAASRAGTLLDRFAGRRVLVVGDAMLDRFTWGEVTRISPEAPVPVVRVRRETLHLGGAANVAANLNALGARVRLAAVHGSDDEGQRLRGAVTEKGIASLMVEDSGRSTTVKTRVVAQARQILRVDRDGDGRLSGEAEAALLSRVQESLSWADALVLSDYAKGVLSPEPLERILNAACAREVPVLVDPKPVHFPLYQPITLLTPNQAEAAEATSIEIRSDRDCLAAAERILEMLRTRAVLITRGERGMLLLERGRDPVFIPAVARDVFDVTGAGDTVAAVMALSLAAGGDLETAAELANRAASFVVSKVGTATVPADELRTRIVGRTDLRPA